MVRGGAWSGESDAAVARLRSAGTGAGAGASAGALTAGPQHRLVGRGGWGSGMPRPRSRSSTLWFRVYGPVICWAAVDIVDPVEELGSAEGWEGAPQPRLLLLLSALFGGI